MPDSVLTTTKAPTTTNGALLGPVAYNRKRAHRLVSFHASPPTKRAGRAAQVEGDSRAQFMP